jgi:hypothetical protein
MRTRRGLMTNGAGSQGYNADQRGPGEGSRGLDADSRGLDAGVRGIDKRATLLNGIEQSAD